jgi:NDP-sugar pyrophosphorylase family protein
MVADGSLYALDGDTYWIDAGTPATYLAANLDLLSGRRGKPEDGVDPAATVLGDVVRSAIAPGVRIEEGATVTGSVLLEGVVVRSGAVVRHAVIGPSATIGAGAHVTDGAVIGDHVIVPDGATVCDARIPESSA